MPPATELAYQAPRRHPSARSLQRMEALQRANEIRTRRAQLKRDLKAGRASIHTLLLEPPEYVETAKVFDMLLAVPKYGRVKVEQDSAAVPDLAEQDDRRPLRAPAHRARRPAPPVGLVRSRGGSRLRHHRPLGGRQGDADPRAARAHARAGAGVSATTRAPASRRDATGSTTTSSSDAEFAAARGRRGLRRARRLLGPPLRHAALGARAAAPPPATRWCSRSSCRGRARCARRVPEAVQVFIAPPSLERCARASIGRGTDDDDEIERAPARGDARSWPPSSEFAPRGGQRPPGGRRRRSSSPSSPPRCATASSPHKDRLAGRQRSARGWYPRGHDQPAHRLAARARRLQLRLGDRGRQARPPDQLVLPQPRRGDVRRVPAADGRHRLARTT